MEFNSKIIVDTEGINDFIKGLQRAEEEIKIIEAELRKVGLPEDKIRAQATAFRNKMIADVKAVENARIASEKRVQEEQASTITKQQSRLKRALSATRSIGREALGVFIGGGLGEIFGNVVNGLNSVLEANKNTDTELGQLDKSLSKLKVGFTNIALTVLRFVSGPMNKLISAASFVSENLFGISFEADKASVSVGKLQQAFNDEIEVLKDSNLSTEARNKLISEINEKYKDYLPNLIDEKDSIEEITIAQNEANKAFDTRIKQLAAEELITDLTKQEIELLQEKTRLEKEYQEERKANQRLQSNVFEYIGKINEANIRRQKEANRSELIAIRERQEEIKKLGGIYDSIKNDLKIKTTIEDPDEDDKGGKNNPITIYGKINVESDITDATADDIKDLISKGEFAAAEEQLERLNNQLGNITLRNKELVEAKEILEDLQKQLADLYSAPVKGGISDISRVLFPIDNPIGVVNESGIIEIINKDLLESGLPEDMKDEFFRRFADRDVDGNFRLFDTPALNEEEADRFASLIYKDLLESGYSGDEFTRKLIEDLENVGITSKPLQFILDGYNKADEKINQVTKSLNKQAAAVEKLEEESGGISSSDIDKIKTDIEDITTQMQDAREEINKEAAGFIGPFLRENLEIYRELGESTFFDVFETTIEEFANNNRRLIEEIEKDVQRLNAIAGEEVVRVSTDVGQTSLSVLSQDFENQNQQLVEALRIRVDNLIGIRRIQQKELERLDIQFVDDELANFVKGFKDKERELSTALGRQKLLIEVAQENLTDTYREFDLAKKREDREYNEEELDILRKQIDNIIALEQKRFKMEKNLRVGYFFELLNESRFTDVDTTLAQKEFQLKEAELYFEHRKNLQAIADRLPDEEVTTEKLFMTKEEAIDLGQQTANAFSDVFNAYLSYQDAIGQAAIDKISAQLDFINEELSETTSNLDSLEADLEGKREGRREALLRGIELEKQREESLTEKKIQQEKLLEEEEKRQSERRKSAAIAQALINAAVAITGTWAGYASLGVAGLVGAGIQTAAITASTAFEIATIQAQEFADGGILEGASHAQGGIPFTLDGVPGFEAEGGEAIINKRSTQMYKPLLSAINEAGGGKKFQQGAVLGANFDSINQDLGGITRSQINDLLSKPTFVSVTDINNINRRMVRVTERSSI